jgi:hypothetical protein
MYWHRLRIKWDDKKKLPVDKNPEPGLVLSKMIPVSLGSISILSSRVEMDVRPFCAAAAGILQPLLMALQPYSLTDTRLATYQGQDSRPSHSIGFDGRR